MSCHSDASSAGDASTDEGQPAATAPRRGADAEARRPVRPATARNDDCAVLDYLFARLPDLSHLVLVQAVVPLALLYITYTFGTGATAVLLAKYAVLLFVLRYVYRLLKREPHPSRAGQYNSMVSGQLVLVLLCVFVITEFRLVDLRTITVFGKEFSLNQAVAAAVGAGYAALQVLTRSAYSADVLNTYIVTHLLYHAKVIGR